MTTTWTTAYPYQLVRPSAFSLYFPGKDMLAAPGSGSYPLGLCVDFLEGADNLVASREPCRCGSILPSGNPRHSCPDIVGIR